MTTTEQKIILDKRTGLEFIEKSIINATDEFIDELNAARDANRLNLEQISVVNRQLTVMLNMYDEAKKDFEYLVDFFTNGPKTEGAKDESK